MTTKIVDIAEQKRLNEAREAPVPLGMGGLFCRYGLDGRIRTRRALQSEMKAIIQAKAF